MEEFCYRTDFLFSCSSFSNFVAPAVARAAVSIDLPDILDGGARRRRAIIIVVTLAALALFGAIAMTIASQYRPM